MTLQSNLKEHLSDIDVGRMAATVADAVKLALATGVSFLWVDAFCIIQDSESDRSVELNKMGDIYSGAICTYSIASARSSVDGFLDRSSTINRMIIRDSPTSQALIEFSYSGQTDIPVEPLNERAWTLQETILSPILVTVFSDGRAPLFRCKTEACTADGGKIRYLPRLLEYGVSTRRDDYFKEQDSEVSWFEIVEEYSRRKLTHKRDKFPAIAAIAKYYEGIANLGTYHAGLFTEALCWELLWSCGEDSLLHKPARSPRYAESNWLAPTWSWASRDHPIRYVRDWLYPNLFHSSDNIKDLSFDIQHAPNGDLESASLTMRCYSWSIVCQKGWLESATRSGQLDDDPCTLNPGDEVWYVHLAKEEPYNNALSFGLILQEIKCIAHSTGPAVFRRVGMYVNGPRSYFTTKGDEVINVRDLGEYSGFPREVKTVERRVFKII